MVLWPASVVAQEAVPSPPPQPREATEGPSNGSLPLGVPRQARTDAQLNPEQWAQLILEACAQEKKRWEDSLAALEAQLKDLPRSRQELEFPQAERQARRKTLNKQRRSYLARLDYLLQPQPRGSAPLHRTLGLLLAEATPCSLDALDSTLLFAAFDVPFTQERFEVGLSFEQAYLDLQRSYLAGLVQFGSLEEVYRRLRPQQPEMAFRYLDELLTRLADISQRRSPEGEPARGEAQLHARSRLVQGHARLAAESMRIRTYLYAKVEELQGALGTNVPERTVEKLFARTAKRLYANEQALAVLAATPPERILSTLEQVLDQWFRTQALPAVLKALWEDPFSAYWFFVQTGGVARGPVAFKGSRVRPGHGIFELGSLKRLSLREALERLRRERIPPAFLNAHASLEQAFTEMTLTRDEALEQIEAIQLRSAARVKLRRWVAAQPDTQKLSTLDIYTSLVQDANQIGGAADWGRVRAALQLLHNSKRERLQQEIAALLPTARAEVAGRLAHYLTTLSEMMLELELRQATERRFQEATGGGVTRWVLRDLLMSPGVPIQLWVPGGVSGNEFAELVNEIAPKNSESRNPYHGKPTSEIRLVRDGREFYQGLIEVIDTADSFLNLAFFSWKADQGGKEITYRLMAKKLGIEGEAYERFLAAFRQGLPLAPGEEAVTRFYDIPPGRMKNLLVYFFFTSTDLPAIVQVRRRLETSLGAPLSCASVATCGDLSTLRARAGSAHDGSRASQAGYQETWEAYRDLQALFEEKDPDFRKTQPRDSLADYVSDADRLRTFVRRHGRKRQDDPESPFPINMIVEGKQNLDKIRFGDPSRRFPHLLSDPVEELSRALLEFEVRVLLWKGPVEFPWHLGPLPLPGRKMFGVVPIPYIPYPWLHFVPGFGWAGAGGSLFLQHLLATDLRGWWAMAMHVKSISNESRAMESGMGLASKYFNAYTEFATWHDVGVKVTGPLVGDLNDHFVQIFNRARVNNAGIPRAYGVKIPRLRYDDYHYPGPSPPGHPSWVLTTDPEKANYNYRGVFLAALAAARENIFIENPFFTDPLVGRMLLRKAREFRGRVNCENISDFECAQKKRAAVKIYLVLPDSTDQPLLDIVSHAYLHELLHLGVKIYRWNPQRSWSAQKMLHSKAWLIDYEEGAPALAYVGSANTTQRSHLADNEMGIVSLSPEFARELYERLFCHDLTTGARLESTESLPLVGSKKRLARSGRWLGDLLVNVLWFF